MRICIKCGHTNADHMNYCEKCNAVLFKMATGAGPDTSMELEEGREYLVPQRSYPTEHLYNLTCRAYEYIHHEAPGEPLLEAYQVVKEKLDVMEHEQLPAQLDHLKELANDDPEDEYSRQVMYLLKKGVALYREGCTMMDQFVESGDTQTLIDAVTKMQEGNDNLGLALEIGQTREGLIHQELESRKQQARMQASSGAAESRARAGGAATATATEEAPVEEPVVDDTDLA